MGKLRTDSEITTIVIHCAATTNGVEHTANDIDDWHAERRFKRNMSIDFDDGFPAYRPVPELRHIGYHFVIELDGNVVAGRPLAETGAHVRGHNQNSVGICMIGTDAFSLAQWRSLTLLVDHLSERFAIRDDSIVGHRDLYSGKTCPGFDVADWLERFYTPHAENIWVSPHD